MIKSNLPHLMADKRIKNINKLSLETGVSAPTLHRLYDGTNTRVDYATLEALCSYFNCQVGELLTWEKGQD
jgi:putative transcriptional regulator